jgi:hypothetical protein
MNGRGFGRGFGGGFPGAPGHGGIGPGGFARHAFFPGGGIFFLLLAIAVSALVVFLFWRILRKAGYEGAWSLLMLVPLVNIGLMAYIALEEWPVLKQLRELRMAYASCAQPGPAAAPAPAPAAMPAESAAVTAQMPTAPVPPVEPAPAQAAPEEAPADSSSAPTQPIERPKRTRRPKA